jgi:O-antigen/teichoic acid export membrane protein
MVAASQVTIAITGAAATIAIARLLGPSDLASYALAQSLVLVLIVLATLGIELGLTYYVSSGAWDARSAAGTAIAAAAGMGATAALLGLAIRAAAPSALGRLSVGLTVVAVAAVPFALAWFLVSGVGLAVDRYEAFAVPPALQSILVLVLAPAAGAVFGLSGTVAGTTAAGVVVGLGCCVWARRRLTVAETLVPARAFRRAVSFGIKGWTSNVLQIVNYRLDLFILAAVASRAVVGRYAIAVAVTSTVWLLPQALASVAFPRIARLDSTGVEADRTLVETKSLRISVLLSGLGAIVVAVALELLVVPVFGEAFSGSVVPGLLLLPGVAAVGVAKVLMAALAGRGRPVYSLYAALVATPVTIALYAALIPWLDANGAALASTLSYLLTSGLLAFFFRRLSGLPLLPLLRPTRAEWRDLLELPRQLRRSSS